METITNAVVEPKIPLDLLDETTQDQLGQCGFCLERTPEGWALFADEYASADENGIFYTAILQDIVRRSGGQLQYVKVTGALTCTDPDFDNVGGYAEIITSEEIKYFDTLMWLKENVPA